MCNSHCIEFGRSSLSRQEVNGKKVIEIGAYDVNGSMRSVIAQYNPAEYIGVDITKGYGVDIVCSAEDVRKRFGDNRFDVVVSTEMLEHIRDWRKVIGNIKHLCKANGIVLITTRSAGFAYHGYPFDFWRYETSDMEQIFSDFIIDRLEKDPGEPGVFMKAKKPADFKEKDLSQIALYSVVTGTRSSHIDDHVQREFEQKNIETYGIPERESFKKRTKRHIRDIYWKIKTGY